MKEDIDTFVINLYRSVLVVAVSVIAFFMQQTYVQSRDGQQRIMDRLEAMDCRVDSAELKITRHSYELINIERTLVERKE